MNVLQKIEGQEFIFLLNLYEARYIIIKLSEIVESNFAIMFVTFNGKRKVKTYQKLI